MLRRVLWSSDRYLESAKFRKLPKQKITFFLSFYDENKNKSDNILWPLKNGKHSNFLLLETSGTMQTIVIYIWTQCDHMHFKNTNTRPAEHVKEQEIRRMKMLKTKIKTTHAHVLLFNHQLDCTPSIKLIFSRAWTMYTKSMSVFIYWNLCFSVSVCVATAYQTTARNKHTGNCLHVYTMHNNTDTHLSQWSGASHNTVKWSVFQSFRVLCFVNHVPIRFSAAWFSFLCVLWSQSI